MYEKKIQAVKTESTREVRYDLQNTVIITGGNKNKKTPLWTEEIKFGC